MVRALPGFMNPTFFPTVYRVSMGFNRTFLGFGFAFLVILTVLALPWKAFQCKKNRLRLLKQILASALQFGHFRASDLRF